MSVLHKNIRCGYSLESPWRGDSNEYPQHIFLWRNKENYPLIITKYPPYLFHWVLFSYLYFLKIFRNEITAVYSPPMFYLFNISLPYLITLSATDKARSLQRVSATLGTTRSKLSFIPALPTPEDRRILITLSATDKARSL